MEIYCKCIDCVNNSEGECEKENIIISDEPPTVAGFIPLCRDYKEREESNE